MPLDCHVCVPGRHFVCLYICQKVCYSCEAQWFVVGCQLVVCNVGYVQHSNMLACRWILWCAPCWNKLVRALVGF